MPHNQWSAEVFRQMEYDGKCPNGCPTCTPDKYPPLDPFRKVLDYVEDGDAESLVDAVLNIVYAHAAKGARAGMIAAAVDKYRGVES